MLARSTPNFRFFITLMCSFWLFATCESPIMHLICPSKFCISIVFSFSWDGCNTRGKWKTKDMQNFGGQIRCIYLDVRRVWVSCCLSHNEPTRNQPPLDLKLGNGRSAKNKSPRQRRVHLWLFLGCQRACQRAVCESCTQNPRDLRQSLLATTRWQRVGGLRLRDWKCVNYVSL